MPRPRQYESNAARQKAYRERLKRRKAEERPDEIPVVQKDGTATPLSEFLRREK